MDIKEILTQVAAIVGVISVIVNSVITAFAKPKIDYDLTLKLVTQLETIFFNKEDVEFFIRIANFEDLIEDYSYETFALELTKLSKKVEQPTAKNALISTAEYVRKCKMHRLFLLNIATAIAYNAQIKFIED